MKLFLIAILFIMTNLSSLVINLRNKAFVSKSTVYLKDIAYTEKDRALFKKINHIEIYEMDKKDSFVNLSAAYIRNILKDQITLPFVLKGGMSVVRWEKKQLSEAYLKSEIENFIAPFFENSNIDYVISVFNKDFYADDSVQAISFSFAGNRPILKGHVVLIAELFNQTTKKIAIPIEIKTYEKICRLKTSQKRNEPILSRNIKCIVEETTDLYDYFTSVDDLKERQTSRYILGGQILTSRNTQKIPDIKRGDRITVKIMSKNIEIKLDAISKESGYKGDIINCQNPTTKRRFEAEVVDSKFAIIHVEG